ncbi:glycosyltransferase family 4 protein [Sulfurimonas sp.]|uniref:glycosyltransferase family 4 protein n=1 Tax=Sulfurimonas sp. TaxID=2022749 RepID=UPI002627ECBD|nr:glycosyltransferase family 4 protein [Sulfurimonas sp.]MCW8895357.1 glycosyltransferase family 4 protein [Sulfurimonas sp.]MCW9067500.1 glycosyltransferase family 4 protein [Sulfurimonas sp.]
MKKKILIVTEYFYPEEFKINEIAIEWKEKGYDVDVLTQNPTYPFGKIYKNYDNKWYSKDTYEGINIYRVKTVTGYKVSLFKKLLKYFTFMMLGSIVSLKIGKKYDYVFGFDVGALTGMVPAVLLKKIYNKKVTLWIQDVWPDSVYAYGFKKRKILEFILDGFVKFVYRNSSNFAVSGKGFIDRVSPYVENDKKIEYLPNWADEFNEDLVPLKFSEEKKIHFTFAGNIGKVQNLDNIIKAFGGLGSEYIEKAQLNIIGDGSYFEDLKNLVNENNFKNIVFWGRKPREEMYKYFSSSDFLIVSLIDKPIFSLTVPAKVQTYIAAKKPILAVINGDAADIIRDNNLGYCANPSDISEIKETFMKCINADEKIIQEFTKNCEHLTNSTFNKNKIIDSLLQLLAR